jgi:hypothetical protein
MRNNGVRVKEIGIQLEADDRHNHRNRTKRNSTTPGAVVAALSNHDLTKISAPP